MTVAKRVFVYIVLITSALAWADWSPLHYQWWHNGEWPWWAGQNFQQWSEVRATVGRWLCPPCLALAETPMYFAFFEVEAGPEEREALLGKEPTLTEIYWKAGDEWYPVSVPLWYLYFLPQTVLWWWLYASDLFAGRWPWWVRMIVELRRKHDQLRPAQQ